MTVIPFPGGRVTDADLTGPPCLIGGRRPHPAEHGWVICLHHREELGTWLHDIQREAERLSAVPSMSTVYDAGSTTLASHRAPANLEVIAYRDRRTRGLGRPRYGPACADPTCDHPTCWDIRDDRDDVLGVLSRWAQRTRDERHLGPPMGDATVTLRGAFGRPLGVWERTVEVPPTVTTERRLLSRHLDYIAGRPWVVHMHRQIGALRRSLLDLNRNADDKPLPGRCIWLVDGRECGGHLWPTEPVHTTGYETRDGTRAVVCGRDDAHRWEGDDLPRLLVIVAQQRTRNEEAAS